MSGISEEGSHSIVYIPNLPAGVSSSDVSYVTTNARMGVVNVEVARYLSRAVGVHRGLGLHRQVDGGVLVDYHQPPVPQNVQNDFKFSPETVVVSGRAEFVNQVAYARVTVTEENLTGNVEGDFPFQRQLLSHNVHIPAFRLVDDLDVLGDKGLAHHPLGHSKGGRHLCHAAEVLQPVVQGCPCPRQRRAADVFGYVRPVLDRLDEGAPESQCPHSSLPAR